MRGCNALAIEGAKIDESIKELCAKKDKVVAFLDGDRAGGFILKELKSVVNIDLELRADEGVEVEELTPQRIADILNDANSDVKQQDSTPKQMSEDDKQLAEVITKVYQDLNETLESIGLDSKNDQLFKVPISELVDKLSTQTGIKYLILDGIITQRLLDSAKQSGIECIVGHRIANLSNTDGITLKTFTELGIN
jgi:5S rRNA maturation endonuclease (ribonuclease M5)